MFTTEYRYKDSEIRYASTDDLVYMMEQERQCMDCSNVHKDNYNRIVKELNNRNKHNTTNRGY